LIIRRPENRLSKQLFAPGGKAIDQALHDAATGLEAVRRQSLDELREKLKQIQAVGRSSLAGPESSVVENLHILSGEILEIAEMFGMPQLSQAADGFCELLDRLGDSQAWSWPAVQVHLHGLLVLADPLDASPEASRAVVEGLRQVRERMAAKA
jgi:hypothetical protein